MFDCGNEGKAAEDSVTIPSKEESSFIDIRRLHGFSVNFKNIKLEKLLDNLVDMSFACDW